MTTQNLLVELFVEELPPKALKKLGEAFARVLFESLQSQGLCAQDAQLTHFATPRRLAAHVTQVQSRAADRQVQQKLMPVSVGLDASGAATPALLKRLQAVGGSAASVAQLKRAMDGKAEALFWESVVAGATLAEGLQKALNESLAKLPIPKVMTYQLGEGAEQPGWTNASFVRPAHALVALHGSEVVPVQTLGLQSGRTTQGHRFEALSASIPVAHADHYEATLLEQGAVIASFAKRRESIVFQLNRAAALVGSGVTAIEDEALLDEVTALVERPNVLMCQFEPEFLEVPQECLILTMKANQKYFPLLDAAGKLTNKFLVVSNISPTNPSAVIGGNERVVRPRLADAKFFFDQDRKKTLLSRVAGLDKVVYHNQLGSQGERVQRVQAIAKAIGQQLGGEALAYQADQAAQLAKADLLTDMVGEFPELQGTMGRYYALNDSLSTQVADAIEDHYKPRFAGDSLPRGEVGVVLALADKLETLVGMFGTGNLPTGDKDPFALRRHALGVIRLLSEKDLPLDLDEAVRIAAAVLHAQAASKLLTVDALVSSDDVQYDSLVELWRSVKLHFSHQAKFTFGEVDLLGFIYDRLAGSLREQGYSAQEVDAVVSQQPQRLADVPKRLMAVRAFARLPEAPALAAANKRISNILKKVPAVDAHVSPVLLREDAEVALYAALQAVGPQADQQFNAGDYAGSLQSLASLRGPVDSFFDSVMVNADELDLRLNRQGLLTCLHNAMNRVADLSRLVA